MSPLRFLAALIAVLLPLLAKAESAPEPVGHWEGTIDLSATQLGIRVDLERTGEDWAGTIDIPAQGLRGFKLQPVTVAGAAVRFTMPAIPGNPTFAGKFDKDAGTIGGEFTQGAIKAPFKLTRRARPAPGAGEVPAKGLPGEGIAGNWLGSLKPNPVIELRLALSITSKPDGGFAGTMVSLDQDRAGIPITEFTESAGKVSVKIASIGGAYDGQINADGSELVGDWQQGGLKFPLVFKRVATAPALQRPQDPRKPYPYAEEEVTIRNEAAGMELSGTLTIPPGAGPHPAVVLVTGSGPQDRDEALMGHRPFLVLADHLTRAGIAVLRYDDRGVGRSTGDFGKATTEDFTEDALAAVAWLRTRPEIDAHRIGLIGHSEGGIVAPLAAVKMPNQIAFIVLLAGVGVPMEELLIQQGADLQRVMGMSAADIAKNTGAQRELFSMIKATADDAEAQKRAREIMTKLFAEISPEQRQALGYSDAMMANQIKMIVSPWFRKLLAYDPRPTLRRVKCPVLAVNGEKDLQVAAKENLASIREALAEGGNTHSKVMAFPGLNHLFQNCATGAVAEYGQIEETIAPAVLDAVSTWIRAQSAQ